MSVKNPIRMGRKYNIIKDISDNVDVVTTKYGLFYIPINGLVGFYTSSNADGDFCVSTQYILDASKYNDALWLVNSYEEAEKARTTNTPWYNADYNSPTNPYKPEDLEVVKVIIRIQDCEKKVTFEVSKYKSSSSEEAIKTAKRIIHSLEYEEK